MGIGDFISKTFGRNAHKLSDKHYFQLGVVRFSNLTYGFPIRTVSYYLESASNTTTYYTEASSKYTYFAFKPVIPIFRNVNTFVTFLSSYLLSPAIYCYKFYAGLSLKYKIALLIIFLLFVSIIVFFIFTKVIKGKASPSLRAVSSRFFNESNSNGQNSPKRTELSLNTDIEPILSPEIKAAYRLITMGTTLVKHGRMYTRSIRSVAISTDMKQVSWRNVDDNKQQFIPLSTFSRVDCGCRDKHLRYPEACLVSFVGKTPKDRSLHFEFFQYTTAEENYVAASEWVDALHLCMSSAADISCYLAFNKPEKVQSPYKRTSMGFVPKASPVKSLALAQ